MSQRLTCAFCGKGFNGDQNIDYVKIVVGFLNATLRSGPACKKCKKVVAKLIRIGE